ncbi:SDR family NAD(P)-dependent oxidoreductase [Limosilactobacillus vaginalis]|uniref:SDR family NAD(P)-dependent oxidoreductase n=1 Tax=Limosilactobacillus vaginalis TaxID=1633 RepID=UPI00241C407C|nr:SDR family oxidoreductase [Limosilactobacillus vaginalis]
MGKLDGKIAIVTGAGSGMGKATAELFAKEGATVIASDINSDRLADFKNDHIIPFASNVADEKEVQAMIDKAKELGHLDILVNNAGIMDNFKTVDHLDDETWNRVLGVNLNGPFYTCRAAVKVMKEQPAGGVILNIASIGGLFGGCGGCAYTVSKHGLIGLTKNIAAVYGYNGKIRTNAISPGGVATNIMDTISEIDQEGVKPQQRLGENLPIGTSEDIAQAALFMVSDESKFVNGAVLTADGGLTDL